MSSKLRSVTVKLPSSMWDQIKTIAEKRGETVSDTIRHLMTRGLDERIYEENTELITRVVKEQMEAVMHSYLGWPDVVYSQRIPQRKQNQAVDPRRLAICRKTG